MAISLKAVGSYIDLTNTSTVVIPGSPASGDRMVLLAAWKDYSLTATPSAGWTAIGSAYADGAVSAGNGSGSMMVQAWYRDWVAGDSNPSLTGLTGAEGGAAVIQLWQKDHGEIWSPPLSAGAAWASSSSQTVSATGTTAVPNGAAVIALAGFADAITTITRATTDIDVASGITWNGNYVESPSTHYSSSAELNSAVDVGYRLVTTGGTVTLRMSATLSTAETGAVKFVVLGVSSVSSEILRPIDGLEEYAANTTWQDIDDVVTQPTTPGSANYLEYAGTSITTYTEKWLVAAPTPGYTIRRATLWVLAKSFQALPNMYIYSVRIKLNGVWYDLGVGSKYISPTTVQWYSFALAGLTESTDSDDIGFELVVVSTGAHVDQKLQIDAAYLELNYLSEAPAAGGFFAWL